MTHSHDEIVANQRRENRILTLSGIAILIVTSLVLLIPCDQNTKRKVCVSYGLILDILGIILASYPIIFPLRKKTKEGVQYLSNIGGFRTQALVEYSEKHGLKARIGISLIAFGFIMQFVGIWL